MRSAIHLISLLLLFLIWGCSSDTTDPGNGAGDDPDPQPNPEGVLLTGDASGNAMAALVELPPSRAPDSEVDGGLLLTRLSAVLDRNATVGQINAALEAVGARISSMYSDELFVTLKIPAVADEAGAQVVADQIAAAGGFSLVMPAWQADVSPPKVDGLKELPPSGTGSIDHLIAMRFPAAWNAKGLAEDIGVKTIVIVPDCYTDDIPHAEIGCQQFRIGTDGPTSAVYDGMYVGNHGYGVCSALGADYDGDAPTGTSPDPQDLLEIRSVHVAGIAWPQILREIYERLPWGTPFVLSTSLGYNQPNDAAQKLRLALDTLYWRSLIAGGSGNFLHLTAAGNAGTEAGDHGESRFNSPFTTAHMFDDLREVIAGAGVAEVDSLELALACDFYEEQNPLVVQALTDVLVVGASDNSGIESDFSNRGSQVRAVGEGVLVACTDVDPDHGVDPTLCDGSVWSADGTSFATPLVAGLTAYMWSMDIDLPPAQMRAKIVHAYQNSTVPGLVDAYLAVLSLDNFYVDHRVRDAILDVSGADGQPGSDGIFDEKDLDLYVAAFQAADGALDHSRYDLNGDGRTGGDSGAKFDLTFEPVPQWGPGEMNLTDCEILDYYANHPEFYSGDEDERDRIMVFCDPVPLDSMVRVNIFLQFAATFTEQGSGDTSYDEDYDISVQAEGTIENGNINFAFAEFSDWNGDVIPVNGTVIGTIADRGRLIAVLHVDYGTYSTSSGERTTRYTLTNVPLTSYGDYYAFYNAEGPDVCANLSDVVITYGDGAWTLTNVGCTAGSRASLHFYD